MMFAYSNSSAGGNQRTCVNFTKEALDDIIDLKLGLTVFAIVANIAIVFLLVCSNKLKEFVYRLIFYMMIVGILQSVAINLTSLPIMRSDDFGTDIKNGSSWHHVCSFTGFIMTLTLWMGNCILLWMVFYLLWLGWSLNHHVFRRPNWDRLQANFFRPCCQQCPSFSRGELFGILFLILVPFLIASIPFIKSMYGLAGPWCWIKQFNEKCGDLHYVPFILEIVLFFAPFTMIMFLAIVFTCITFICFCRGQVRRHEKIVELKRRYINEIVILVACPLIYSLVIVLLWINQYFLIKDVNTNPSGSPLRQVWLAHSAGDSLRVLLPAVVILLNPCVWKDVCVCSRKPNNPEEQPVRRFPRSARDYGSINNRAYVDSLMATNSNTSTRTT